MSTRPPVERTYRIQVAAELSGVSVELIRAWERRHGVLQPRRTPAGYRVYTDRDVALLRRLRALTEGGTPISQAAELVPQLLLELAAAPQPAAPPSSAGAHALDAWRARALAAGEALDQPGVGRVLDEVLGALGPLRAVEEVLLPLQREVGERWHAGGLSVAQEHLVTQAVRARLLTLLHVAPEAPGARRALLACFPDEEHELGLLAAALRLRHAGWAVTLLGQRTPAADVVSAAGALARGGPGLALVGLSCVTAREEATFAFQLADVLDGLPRGVPVCVGGAGAAAHPGVCARQGVRLVQGEADWAALLGG